MVPNKNEFGDLVKAYRKQRGWTQEELSERWGHTRGYVAQIEGGKRKLDDVTQLIRLADILNIPSEKLETIGRYIPTRKTVQEVFSQNDESLLQLFLPPSRDMVKLSYMLWLADQHPMIEPSLHNLTVKLRFALTSYRGNFAKQIQQLLAYTHQMLGKIAFDRLDFASAGGHFSEMVDIGQELHDADIIALGMIRQGDVLRKRGRYETALNCFRAAQAYVTAADQGIQGLYQINMARLYYFRGDEQEFLSSINPALDIASEIKEESGSLVYWFNLDVVLQFQASGYTALRKPQKAIEVYKEIERYRPSRPLRDQGAYTIEKARAFLEVGDLDKGIEISLRGLQQASVYRSKRHIARLEATYNRLHMTPLGKDRRLHALRDALLEVQSTQDAW